MSDVALSQAEINAALVKKQKELEKRITALEKRVYLLENVVHSLNQDYMSRMCEDADKLWNSLWSTPTKTT